MSITNEEKMNKLLDFPYDAFLMVRLEYVQILEDELQAKILRIIEKYVDIERKRLYQQTMNTAVPSNGQIVEITKDIWVPISYRLFMNDLFGTVTSENTVKKALKDLIKKRVIFQRFEPKKKYDAPEYKIHVSVLQTTLNLLTNPGYQTLIPSIFDTLKNLPPQEMTLSECQKLIPLATLRVSKIDTNITRVTDNREEITDDSNSIGENNGESVRGEPLVAAIADDTLTHSSSIQSLSTQSLHIAAMDTSSTDASMSPDNSSVTTRNGDNHADLPAWSANGDSAFRAPGVGDNHAGNGNTGQMVQVGQKEEIDGQLDEEATIHRMPAIKPQGDNHELSVHRSDYRGPHDDDLHHCHADTERSLALSSDEALRASGTANIAARVASETGNEGVEYHASNHHSSQPHRGDSSGMGATHSPGLAQSTVALQAGNGGDTAPTGRDVALEESTPEAPHEQDDSAQASPPSAVVNPGHNPLHRSDDVPRVPPTGYQPSSNMFSTENVDKPVDHNRVDKPPAPDKQAENATPTGKGTRKPRQTKPKVDDARIKAVFACMDATIRELTGDKTFTYTQPKTDQKIIADFIGEHEVSPIHLRENMIEMWNTPKDEKSGFEWKNNMSVRAIFNNYDRFRIMLNGKKNGHKPPATARPPSHVSVPQNDEPLVVWRPPTKTAQYHSMAARGR